MMSQVAKRTVIVIVGVAVGAAFLIEWVAHQRAEHHYRAAREAQQQLELELGQIRAERDQLRDAFVTEQQRVEGISKTLLAKDAELQEAIARLAQEERTIQELEARLLAMQRQFDLLQGELAVAIQARPSSSSPTAGGIVQLEKVVVSPSTSPRPGFHGRVISVNPEWRFVVIDLGWDVVKIGDVVSIYRNEQLLGKARVERVQEQVSAATLLPEWLEAEIQVNDAVRAL